LTRGVPKYIRSDNGPEFISRAVCQWLQEKGCQTIFITPGSPWENGYIESFFDKMRDECLNREIFRNGKEAQTIVENWRQEYNNHRPHSSLGYLAPVDFARRYYEKIQAKEIKQTPELQDHQADMRLAISYLRIPGIRRFSYRQLPLILFLTTTSFDNLPHTILYNMEPRHLRKE